VRIRSTDGQIENDCKQHGRTQMVAYLIMCMGN